jgi:hypothetical protein
MNKELQHMLNKAPESDGCQQSLGGKIPTYFLQGIILWYPQPTIQHI